MKCLSGYDSCGGPSAAPGEFVCDECTEGAEVAAELAKADEHEYREQTRQEQREADLSTRHPGGEEDYDGYEDWSEDK